MKGVTILVILTAIIVSTANWGFGAGLFTGLAVIVGGLMEQERK